MNLNFFVGDDYPIARTGVKVLLQKSYESVTISESGIDLNQMLQRLHELSRVDLLIFGISKSNAEALSNILRLHKALPRLRILVLDKSDNLAYAELFLRNGINGYIAKNSDEPELVKAVNTILSGNRYIPLPMIEQFTSGRYHLNLFSKLSISELLLVQFLVEGYGYEKISSHLNLSQPSIKTYRQRIYKKLNLKNISQLVQLATR